MIWYDLCVFPVRPSARPKLLVSIDWSCSPHWYSGGGALLQLYPWPVLPSGAWSVVLVQWCWSEAIWSCADSVRMLWRRNDSKCFLYTFLWGNKFHMTRKQVGFDCTEIERVRAQVAKIGYLFKSEAWVTIGIASVRWIWNLEVPISNTSLSSWLTSQQHFSGQVAAFYQLGFLTRFS